MKLSNGVFVLLLAFLALFIGETDEALSESAADDVCMAKQRAVYTDGVRSWLMMGDPEQDAARYSQGSALPTLLSEGWNIVSVTPAANAKSGDGKTLIVLDIQVLPYDQELTIMEGNQALFPCSAITVGVARRKEAIAVEVFFGDKKLEKVQKLRPINKPWALDKPWNLGNGYSLKVVKKSLTNETLSLTIRLFSD